MSWELFLKRYETDPGPKVTFLFKLNSAEYNILNANNVEISQNSFFTDSDKPRMLFVCS